MGAGGLIAAAARRDDHAAATQQGRRFRGVPYPPIPHDANDHVSVERDLDAVAENELASADERLGLEIAAEIFGREGNRHWG